MKKHLLMTTCLSLITLFTLAQAQPTSSNFTWHHYQGGPMEICKESLLALIDYPVTTVQDKTTMKVAAFDLTVSYKDKGLILVRGNSDQLSPTMREKIKGLEPGDMIYVDNVRVVSSEDCQSRIMKGAMALQVVE